MKVMAIDYGDARTGVAISDALGMITGYTTVVQEYNADKLLVKLMDIIKEHKPDTLVMGLPKNMDGTEGPRAAIYREFAGRLEEASGMTVNLWDERRTTIEAHQILHAGGKKEKKHRKNVDAVAASLILEGYLRLHN